MKITALWMFILITLISYLVLGFWGFVTGRHASTESILITSFAITWALDRDKELNK